MGYWRPTVLLREIRPDGGIRGPRRKALDMALMGAGLLIPASWSVVLIRSSLYVATPRVFFLSTLTLAILMAALWIYAVRRFTRGISLLKSENDDLRLSRVLLDNLMSYFPGLIYFKDRESRFVRISQSHVRHFKLQREEDSWGKTDLDMFTDEHARQAMRDELEIMRSGKPLLDFEEKETWADGRETWCSTSKLPLRNDQNLIIGTFGVSLDITQRRNAEEAARRENAERERAEAEVRQFAEKLAASNAELFERKEALEKEIVERRRAEEETVRTAQELTRTNADLLANQQALEEKQSALEKENAERRRAEEEASRERDLLHALMNNIPDLIYFKDRESRYTRVNRAHADAMDLQDTNAAIGRTDFDFCHDEFARMTREDERRLIETRRALEGRMEYEARHDRWYLSTKVPLLDSAGQVTGLVGISKDITKRKRAEERLERDLEKFLEVVSAVANGDLTQRGTEGDDTLGRIARSVNRMLDGFVSIVSELRDAAFSVSTSSTEILAAATQIAKGAKYGSDQVHATTSAVEEMAASMLQVSSNARQSAESSQRVLEHMRAGYESVAATYHGMTKIDTAASETVSKMKLLEKSSAQIFKIIGLIEEISSQSNLLSLNAAIEAAHAGDAGRGFGVVAEEIRRLAERSTDATKDVTLIVEGIVEETRAVLQAMELGIAEIHAGSALSERAQLSLQEIHTLAQASAQLSDAISAASTEQAQATQTVSHAMQTISGITQQSVAGADETSRAVRDLVSLSEQLNKTISVFKIDTARSVMGALAGGYKRETKKNVAMNAPTDMNE